MSESLVSRRRFTAALTVAGAAVVPEFVSEASAQSNSDLDLKLPSELVDVNVKIVWLPDGAPVDGASIFKHLENELLGKTNKEGTFTTKLPNGTVLRLVEPRYGQQQALRVVQGEREPNRSIRISRVGEGWTIS